MEEPDLQPTLTEETEKVKESNTISISPEEQAILQAQANGESDKLEKFNYLSLYQYSDYLDFVLITIGSLTAIGSGAALPISFIIFGQITQAFSDLFQPGGSSSRNQDAFMHQVSQMSLKFVYLFAGVFVASGIMIFCFTVAGRRQSQRIRKLYLKAILRQNIGYYDFLGAGETTTRMTVSMNEIEHGMSESVGLVIKTVSTFVSAFIIAYIKTWKLSLILTSVLVLLVVTMGFFASKSEKYIYRSNECINKGNSVAEEVFTNVRTVQAFGARQKLVHLYDGNLKIAQRFGLKAGAYFGGLLCSIFFILYCIYSLAFWEGSRLLAAGEVNIAHLFTALFAIILASFSLSGASPHIKSFAIAVASGRKIFETIQRKPPIDASLSEGLIPDTFRGHVELKDIKFVYPARPSVIVTSKLSLVAKEGETTALVGPSGSGKSTVIGLIERFYDPISGEVLLDGHPIKSLNLRWVRSQIALVSQEPVLFATTIYENVSYGLIGTKWENCDEKEKRRMVKEACIEANAHSFIENLHEGYDTDVGERGSLLSGGQKQRIAIARAIIRQPKILLLDEATSALDTKSEGVVQEALDRASKDRTTIVVAHRLSTIKNANKIILIMNGVIKEEGTHQQLMHNQALYHTMANIQSVSSKGVNKRTAYSDEEETGSNEKSDTDIPKLSRTSTVSTSGSEINRSVKPTDYKSSNYTTVQVLISLLKFSREEWKYFFIGILCSIIAGFVFPAQAILLAQTVVAFASFNPAIEATKHHMRSRVNLFAGMFLLLAVVIGIAYYFQSFLLYWSCAKTTRRVRKTLLDHLLKLDTSFYDVADHSTGVLVSYMGTYASDVEGLLGSTLGTLVICLSCIVSVIILSLCYGWKLALVITATTPIIIFSGFMEVKSLLIYRERANDMHKKLAETCCEATSAIRTVASLLREPDIVKSYVSTINKEYRKNLWLTIRTALFYAFSLSIMFLINALCFWYGAKLISTGEYSLTQYFTVFIAITFGAESAGQFFSFGADMSKAKLGTNALLQLLNRPTNINNSSQNDSKLKVEIDGDLEFSDVHFRYPTRLDVPAISGLNFKVKKGQYIAFVGSSGCGKSTTIGLIERFYDPIHGTVKFNGIPATDINVTTLRAQMALVSQEPTLFQGTIRFNIELGLQEADQKATDSDIVQACKKANIHDFIMTLPNGYDTWCGPKGTSLSGGQKQRIAIARALIRNPKILLLDEATSALDSESEKIVQDALDAASEGRTTIAVAHRLSTIKNADKIFVFDKGQIVESGTHVDLIEQRGVYFDLVKMQDLEGSDE